MVQTVIPGTTVAAVETGTIIKMAMETRGESTVVRTSRQDRGTREAETKLHGTTTGAEMPPGDHGMAEATATRIRAHGMEEPTDTRMTAPGTTMGAEMPAGDQGMAEMTTKSRALGLKGAMETRMTAPGTRTGQRRLRGTLVGATIPEGEMQKQSGSWSYAVRTATAACQLDDCSIERDGAIR